MYLYDTRRDSMNVFTYKFLNEGDKGQKRRHNDVILVYPNQVSPVLINYEIFQYSA